MILSEEEICNLPIFSPAGCSTARSLAGLILRFSAPSLEGKFHRITSLNYSRDARELLVSYSSDHVYLYDMKVRSYAKCFLTS